ncbi:MAG: phosphoglucosamine mutase [Desulfatiglandales bacterium]
MGKLFGTDGIRGIVNQEPITPEVGFKIGRSVVHHSKRGKSQPKIVIGRDTRESGRTLEAAVVSGILSLGADAVLVGELPTPGVAFVSREIGADAGIMISASHNPSEYNGFKIFSGRGYKLSDEMEAGIEALILAEVGATSNEGHLDLREKKQMAEAGERYITFLRNTLPEEFTLKGMEIVLDCANGATYALAPTLFEQMGAKVESLFVTPDGKNINHHCGSQYPEMLRARVLETGAMLGLAFDGDGDRLVAVDEKGNALTGDQVLIICAKTLKDRGELTNNLVVSTVMSNMGLPIALKDLGINHISTKVGDRYVLEEMRAKGAILGGENSGHMIFLRHHTTGDGLLSALQLLVAIKTSDQTLSQLSALMTLFPQAMANVSVKKNPEIPSVPELVKVLQRVETSLGEKGRVLVRYSGTEPVCRVMVEGEKQEEIEEYARQIADVVRKKLN